MILGVTLVVLAIIIFFTIEEMHKKKRLVLFSLIIAYVYRYRN